MIKISKDESERMILSVLSELSKVEGKEFSEQSLTIMDDSYDSAILTGVLLNKAKPCLFNDAEVRFQISIQNIIYCFFQTAKQFDWDLKKDGYSIELVDSFNSEDINDDVVYNPSMKVKFAVSQFVSAFLEYERLEKKYPDLMKLM